MGAAAATGDGSRSGADDAVRTARVAVRARGLPRVVAGQGLVLGGWVAVILATNYALTSIPNVKLFDLLVFVAGYVLGVRRGVAVAVLAWLVYGTLNPWGAAGPALLAVLMASEAVYAAAGALARRVLPPGRVRLAPGAAWAVFAGAALFSTVVFDLATNVYTGLVWAGLAGGGTARWMAVAVAGPGALWFMAAHVSSNVVFFALFGPLLVRAGARGAARLR